jgi:hypothetical protein
MRIMEALAQAVTINTDNGPHLRMIFSIPPQKGQNRLPMSCLGERSAARSAEAFKRAF